MLLGCSLTARAQVNTSDSHFIAISEESASL